MTDNIRKTKEFLSKKISKNAFFEEHPESKNYRIEHTMRVAHIGETIAENENMNVEAMVIACLLHDVGYCFDFKDDTDWLEHGRNGARIVRPFLESLNLAKEVIDEICFGIAIHVDDKVDFEGERTPFALTVGDADNLDRFDAYRIYETLEYKGYSKLSFIEKREHVDSVFEKLNKYLELKLATDSATDVWKEKISFQIEFYKRLNTQLETSEYL